MELNAAHVHLLLNHVPILGAVAAAGLLTLALFLRREVLTKAALWTLAAAGVVAVPVYLSGEEAEGIAEDLGVAHSVIESHEEAALFAVIGLGALGVLSLAFLWWTSHQVEVPRWLTGLMWILAVVGATIAGRTAYLGGQIRHTEIRPPELRQQLESGAAGEAEEDEGASAGGTAGSETAADGPTASEGGEAAEPS